TGEAFDTLVVDIRLLVPAPVDQAVEAAHGVTELYEVFPVRVAILAGGILRSATDLERGSTFIDPGGRQAQRCRTRTNVATVSGNEVDARGFEAVEVDERVVHRRDYAGSVGGDTRAELLL